MIKSKNYKFSGHQTFPFRYGWLEKGVRGVERSASIFSDDEALVVLGVGKNMVSSIKHWCLVTQLVEEDKDVKSKRGRFLVISNVGRLLILEGGWDPYLEDNASLWLLHWLLVSNPEVGTTWQVLFSDYHRPDFTKTELMDYMTAFAGKHSSRVSENSLSRDIDCFIRTYMPKGSSTKETLPEDTFECPFQELNLIQPSPGGELYRFAIGPKPSLPAAVFGFAFDQYFRDMRQTQSTMSVQQCLYGKGSPGQAFKLDENSLIEYVEELGELTGGELALDETAGLKRIYRRNEFDALELLRQYYNHENGS